MKKTLMAFYVKVALAVGVPVLCVAVAVAINNNDVIVEKKEIDIIQETKGDNIDLQGYYDKSENGDFENKTEVSGNVNTENGNIVEENSKPVGYPENKTDSEDNTETQTTPQDNIETTPEVPEIPTVPESISGSKDAKYTYDALGRVICVEYDTYKIEYEYDSNGNITSVKKIDK